MDVPGIVESALEDEDEDVAAEVSLGGENELYVTPTRTLIYQSEGFLSDESVDEYPHDASRMTITEGRRKTRVSLEYSLDGTKEFTVPSNATEQVLHPVLAGVLNGSGVTDAGETVTQTFRLDELTLVVTSERLVKHVGGAVWDEDYEEYHFGDVTGLDFEDGSVATQLVLEVDGRPERVKISNDRAAEVKEFLQRALFSYYGVRSLQELNDAVRPEDVDEEERPSPVDFGEGVDPLDAGTTVQPDEGGAAAAPPDGHEGQQPGATGQSSDPRTEAVGQRDDGGRGRVEGGQSASGATGRSRSEPQSNAADEGDAQRTRTGQAETTAGNTSADAAVDAAEVDELADAAFEEAGFEPMTETDEDALVARLDSLEQRVDRQNELLERQHDVIQQLVDELSRGR
ncbi:DUF7115 domain-containing protein [Haloarchaeobius sp. HRN-SO-5]|uniref:DUF7115 domain-containing protein n=1 Tax=Haloarchaeobius sp. HRN-SO-5 TaxID=3446118 RepID=UPI003EB74805